MSFAWAWCFLLLPLPWLLRRKMAPVERGLALRVPLLPVSSGAMAAAPLASSGIAALAWLLLICAAARPQLPADTPPLPLSGRDLMLAFDLSASMATADIGIDGQPAQRLFAARALAGNFLERRQGDRVGLIVFGSQAYLHTPLTYDLPAVGEALATAEVGLAGDKTALGDAIALATKHLRESPATERVLIVLSDGANTAGTLTPQRATWLARRGGVRIHAIGIGSGADETRLKEIAEQSGGSYRRASDARALAEFWRHLDAIEPLVRGDSARHFRRELYPWPLGLALLLVLGLALVRLGEGRA